MKEEETEIEVTDPISKNEEKMNQGISDLLDQILKERI
jgi:hypothetical protein